jgi:hypothetical protein
MLRGHAHVIFPFRRGGADAWAPSHSVQHTPSGGRLCALISVPWRFGCFNIFKLSKYMFKQIGSNDTLQGAHVKAVFRPPDS